MRQSIFAKAIAVVLLCAAVLVFTGAAFASYALYDSGAYTLGYDAAMRDAVEGTAYQLANEAAMRFRDGSYEGSAAPVNFRCVIEDQSGKTLYSDYEGEETLWDRVIEVEPEYGTWTYPAEELEVTPTPAPTGVPRPSAAPRATATWAYELEDFETGERYTFETEAERSAWVREHSLRVHGYVLRDLQPGDEIWSLLYLFQALYGYRNLLPWLAVGSFVLGLLLFAFLIAAAGHHKGEDAVRESFVDKIPLDLFTLLIFTGQGIVSIPLAEWSLPRNAIGFIVLGVCELLVGLQFLLWCMSLKVRVKCGTVWKNNLVCKLWGWGVRLLKKLWALLAKGLKALPFLWRWVVILGALLLFEFICFAGNGEGFVFIVHLVLLCPAVLYIVWQARKLRLAAKEIARGDLNARVDTKGMFFELKEHAEDLNAIRDGVSAAVEERMKSERFRTELITNVSHDIKTPLTSIVSYVDLLEKEELANETARGYVEVLSRQASRLKKLIEDLMDASKASTGALPVKLERLELAVLTDQAAGEYRERMERAGLELIVTKPDAPVFVLADGRQVWRIFDNLLGNIVKYAQPGTRVYLDLAAQGGKAAVTFRNISRSRLNVSGAELTERFVRGDASRSSEGSGLGLSIAMSLAQLQKGELSVTVDGDLFKATLTLPETA